ncbi:MAG: hypothetical protein H6550_03005 [Chitinophagales bacterium]|nr:hypothetical protein [Chitinophagales bacterium]
MKKYVLITAGLGILLFTTVGLYSCKKNNQISKVETVNQKALATEEDGYGPFETTSVTNPTTVTDVNTYISNNVSSIQHDNNGVLETVIFNTQDLSLTTGYDLSVSTYYAYSTNSFGNIQYALAVIYNSELSAYTDYMILKINNISSTYKEIEFYNSSNNLMYTIEWDQANNEARAVAPSGQNVMDCITDFYTNRGWVSVGLWLGTLVDPGIGGCVAAACAIGETVKANY